MSEPVAGYLWTVLNTSGLNKLLYKLLRAAKLYTVYSMQTTDFIFMIFSHISMKRVKGRAGSV